MATKLVTVHNPIREEKPHDPGELFVADGTLTLNRGADVDV